MHIRENLCSVDVLRRMSDATKLLKMTEVEASLSFCDQALPEELRQKWYQLGDFTGGFDLDAILWVWGLAQTDTEMKDLAPHLHDQEQDDLRVMLEYSLINFDGVRYRLHPLVRDYTRIRLGKNEYATRPSHARYYSALLHHFQEMFLAGNEKVIMGLQLFDRNKIEIFSGQAWAAGASDNEKERCELAREYSNQANEILYIRLHPRTWIRWLEAGLRANRVLEDRRGEGHVLGSLGTAYHSIGESRRVIKFHEQALLISRETEDQRGEGYALGCLGTAYRALGLAERAIKYFEESIAICRKTGYLWNEGYVLGSLGIAYRDLGETQRAKEFHEQALLAL